MASIATEQPRRGAGGSGNGQGGGSSPWDQFANGGGEQATERLARALGWLSLGFGAMSLIAPRETARLMGMDDDSPAALRVVGLREIVCGVGILSQDNPTPWLWARVGGDAMDLALLRSAMDSPAADRNRVAAMTAAVLGLTAVDALCALRSSAAPSAAAPPSQPVRAVAAVTIQAPVDEVYGFWDGFRNLPRFMSDIASVEITDDRRSHWRVTGPGGMRLEWDVEITNVTPNERIAWRAADGSALAASGEVRFRPAPRNQGTEVIFDAQLQPPGGDIGKTVARFFAGALGSKIGADLRRCKQLIELGEIVQSDDSIVPGPNPAQPAASVSA